MDSGVLWKAGSPGLWFYPDDVEGWGGLVYLSLGASCLPSSPLAFPSPTMTVEDWE